MNYWTNTCKFKIDKVIYSKWQSGTTYEVSKNKQLWRVYCILKLVRIFFILSISNLSILDFKWAKSTFLANFDVSAPFTIYKSASVA